MLVLLLAGCAGKSNVTTKDKAYVPPPTEASLARGQVLYSEFCQSCHGEQGTGNEDQPEAADLTKRGTHLSQFGLTLVVDKPHYSAETIKLQVASGGKKMPSLGEKFSDIQLEDLTNWVKKLIYQP